MTDITITFSNITGRLAENLKEGIYLVFPDIDQFQVSTPRDYREVSCEEAGCDGCQAIHRKIEGPCHLVLEAHGPKAPEWKVPE